MQEYRRGDNVVSRKIAGEILLVPIKGRLADLQKLYVLNPVAEFIWQSLDGTLTFGDISRRVAEHFEVQPEVAAADVRDFVKSLSEAGLVACEGT